MCLAWPMRIVKVCYGANYGPFESQCFFQAQKVYIACKRLGGKGKVRCTQFCICRFFSC